MSFCFIILIDETTSVSKQKLVLPPVAHLNIGRNNNMKTAARNLPSNNNNTLQSTYAKNSPVVQITTTNTDDGVFIATSSVYQDRGGSVSKRYYTPTSTLKIKPKTIRL